MNAQLKYALLTTGEQCKANDLEYEWSFETDRYSYSWAGTCQNLESSRLRRKLFDVSRVMQNAPIAGPEHECRAAGWYVAREIMRELSFKISTYWKRMLRCLWCITTNNA